MFRWRFSFATMLLATCLLTALQGCGDSKLATFPVDGKVQFADGQPLTGGVVEFESLDPAADHLNAHGDIQPDGSFRLTTYVEGDGAIVGEHAVIVVPPPYTDESNLSGPPPKELVQRKFADYDTSGLKFEVKSGVNHYPITVERP